MWWCRRRRSLRERLAAGDVDVVIGTTALNNDEELFSSLGLVIIDEQHRFGVRQRAQLVKKAPDAPPPHVLFMTATPIPRTIAMTLMSHMSTSVIDELPPGRLPVKCAPPHITHTCSIPPRGRQPIALTSAECMWLSGVSAPFVMHAAMCDGNWRCCRTTLVRVPPGSEVTARGRQKVLQAIEDELAAGGSVFWVFPLVHESEHFQDMTSAHLVRRLCMCYRRQCGSASGCAKIFWMHREAPEVPPSTVASAGSRPGRRCTCA